MSIDRPQLAPKPPLGWNSYDCYGEAITEAEWRANAEYQAKYLLPFGYDYCIQDARWFTPNLTLGLKKAPLVFDTFGRLIPAIERFPSAKGKAGFKPLSKYFHKLGLKFGFHIMRGIPREAVHKNTPVMGTNVRARDIADPYTLCNWSPDMYGVDMSKPGAQAYYDSIFKLYAEWGTDFVKVDDMRSGTTLHRAEIMGVEKAIENCGRPITLSISPGGQANPNEAAFYSQHSHMWRISGDFWDRWYQLKEHFEIARNWQGVGQPGAWADLDMLPLGRIGIRCSAARGVDRQTDLTSNEQVLTMSLWAITRSPLFFGGDMPSLLKDDFTYGLLTNPGMLEINQNSVNNRELFAKNDLIAWTADAITGKAKYLAVFNTSDKPATVKVKLSQLGLKGDVKVYDVWDRRAAGKASGTLETPLNIHAAKLYKLT